ncbi:MAG: hypothetical protein ABIW79_09300 [Gemmatimonas sp.]
MTPPMPAGVPALGIPTRQPTPSAPGNSQTRLADTQPSGVPAQRGMMSPPATTTLVGTPASGRANTLPVPARQPAAATPATGAAGTPETGRRPINPFLNADPGQRARRLARALVSDLVAYHPQKREEGLRSGTLRQVFREEIKKSYEEYVEQVGRELADSSPYFQDALNEILGGGRKLF